MAKQRTLRPNGPGIPMPAFSNEHRPHAPEPEVPDQVRQEALSEMPVSAVASPSVVQMDAVSGRVLRQIPVSLIDPNPLAPREVYTPQMIASRASELRDQGQHDPIHVIPNPAAAGRYIICDGWTRTQACQQHKVLDSLLAEVHHDLTLEEAAWFGYEQNEGREQHCDLDRALFYEKMMNEGVPATEISRRAGVSKSLLTFYRAFSKLPEDVLEIVRQNPKRVGATAAYQLFKLFEQCGTRKTVALAMRYVSEEQSVKWLTNQVQTQLHPDKKKAVEPSKILRFVNGQYKQVGSEFVLNLAVEDATKRAAFAEALEQLIATVGETIEAVQDGAEAVGEESAEEEVD